MHLTHDKASLNRNEIHDSDIRSISPTFDEGKLKGIVKKCVGNLKKKGTMCEPTY